MVIREIGDRGYESNKELQGEGFPEEGIQIQHMVIVIVLALLIVFLAGFLSYNHQVHFVYDHLDWKSWYPRYHPKWSL
jgi:hypothetical protein